MGRTKPSTESGLSWCYCQFNYSNQVQQFLSGLAEKKHIMKASFRFLFNSGNTAPMRVLYHQSYITQVTCFWPQDLSLRSSESGFQQESLSLLSSCLQSPSPSLIHSGNLTLWHSRGVTLRCRFKHQALSYRGVPCQLLLHLTVPQGLVPKSVANC